MALAVAMDLAQAASNPALQAASAGVLALLASLLLIHRAEAWGFVDIPEARKIHSTPTPRSGGIAMVLGGLLTVLGARLAGLDLLAGLSPATLVAGCGFILLGGLDDRFSFTPKGKLGFLVLLSALAAWPWAMRVAAPGFQGIAFGPFRWHPSAWTVLPLGTLWFLAVPNAFNIEDAINGYVSGLTLLILAVCALLGVRTFVPMGALVGFLLLNWPKARHFMGDAGSFGCGFLAAEALLRAGGLEHPSLALILTAPVSLDVAMGMIRRKRKGMSLLDADRYTCPHHLLTRFGGSHLLATATLWANAAVFALLRERALPLALWTMVYISGLVWLNREHLVRARA